MAKYTLTPEARRDLREIANYTESTWSQTQADKYIAQLRAHCQLVATIRA